MRTAVVTALLAAGAGCRTTPPATLPPTADSAASAAVEARSVPIFDGRTGAALTWDDVLARADDAAVIIVGEMHDDAVGHAVQLALVEDVFDRWPQAMLSLEMLERDEQPVVDDYLEDVINAARFERLTHSRSWGGEGSWRAWYLPIIDAAKRRGRAVIAANAPRRYVRLARTDGYDRLRAMPPRRQAFFDLPAGEVSHGYRRRFFEHAGIDTAHGGEGDLHEQIANVESFFRSQLMWDATMAASIADAEPTVQRKVIHLIGQFHSDFDGGTVQQVRARMPDAELFTISLRPTAPADGSAGATSGLREEDRSRAHVVIYTRPHR